VCIDRGAQILDEQVRVRSGRDAHVAVPHEPLHTVHVDAWRSSSVANVCRRSWKRIFSGSAFGQSSRPRTCFAGLPVPSVRCMQVW